MNITFTLDGAAVGSYRGRVDQSEYNITVYHTASLGAREAHNLVLAAGQGTSDSIRLFSRSAHDR